MPDAENGAAGKSIGSSAAAPSAAAGRAASPSQPDLAIGGETVTFGGTLSSSLLKGLVKGEGGAAE